MAVGFPEESGVFQVFCEIAVHVRSSVLDTSDASQGTPRSAFIPVALEENRTRSREIETSRKQIPSGRCQLAAETLTV